MEHSEVSTALGSSCHRSGSEQQHGEVGGFYVFHALWRLIWAKRLSQMQQWHHLEKAGRDDLYDNHHYSEDSANVLWYIHEKIFFALPLTVWLNQFSPPVKGTSVKTKSSSPRLLSPECWMVAGCCLFMEDSTKFCYPLHRCGKSTMVFILP